MSEYIKFAWECRGSATPIAHFNGFAELKACRRRLLQLRLIGVDANGIGFGNLSLRDGATDNFYITGSATAGIPELKPADCAQIVSYDFEKNWIQYNGSVIPSSESLTHAAIYESDKNAGAVIHCHDLRLWRNLLPKAPATSAEVEYGTPGTAHEVMRLFEKIDVGRKRIVVMTGHEGGIIAFGINVQKAFNVLLREWKKNDSVKKTDTATGQTRPLNEVFGDSG